MSLEDDLKKLADVTVTDWPEFAFSGGFVSAIRDLYRSHLRFPPRWSQEECEEFIADNADLAASRLTTELDDLIDTVVDSYECQYGIRPHHEDAGEMMAAAGRSAICALEFDINDLGEELAGVATHSLGRAAASMTGCSPAGRRLQSQNIASRRRS